MYNPLNKIKFLTLASIFALAACDGEFKLSELARKVDPLPGQSKKETPKRAQPDSRGVITYPTYKVLVAQKGDTMASAGERVGLSAQELADYNGLRASHKLRTGEVLALPNSVSGSSVPNASPVDIENIATTAIDEIPSVADAASTTNIATNSGSEPIRHVVEPGETAYSIARLYGVSVTALSSWNGLDRNLSVRDGQQLLIPVSSDGSIKQSSSSVQSAEPEPKEIQVAENTTSKPTAVPKLKPKASPAPTISKPGKGSEAPEPPSSKKPLPKDTPKVEDEPVGVDLSSNVTAPGASRKLLQPVSGKIIRGYKKGANGNDGIDIAASAGTSVKAAEDGEVALISKGADGKAILLIRHPDNLYTVYSNISDVNLAKGKSVKRGQKVGVVAPGAPSYLHFEIRRGTDSVDPTPYL